MKKMRSISVAVILILCISALGTGVYSASVMGVTIIGDLSIIPAIKTADVSVSVQNADNLNVLFECDVVNAKNTSATTITNSGVWTMQPDFSEDTFCNYLRLQTIKLEMLVTNNDSVPISVDISPVSNITQNLVDVTIIGNSYIAPGDTEEVSIQFSAVYDRGTNGSVVEVAAPSIMGCEYNAIISQVDTSESVLSRVKYDATGIANGTMHYYVEFGDNPYYNATEAVAQGSSYAHRAKLRWYIWGKDNGTGAPTALVAGTDYNATTNTFISTGSTYYFISEYVLDTADAATSTETSGIDGLSFNNEYDTNEFQYGGDRVANDYTKSNYRNYLNGVTVKRTYVRDSSYNHFPNGKNVNFIQRYNLTQDNLYSQILDRSLENLYANDSQVMELYPEDFVGETDKFWGISNDDWDYIVKNSITNGIAYDLCYGTTNGHKGYWWSRSPYYMSMIYSVIPMNSGSVTFDAVYSASDSYIGGVRPAFQIII